MADPYISVVIVARNDNYGENFLLRLNTFVRNLDHQVKNYPDLLELVIVEWNPLPGKLLQDVVIKTQHLPVRIITVPGLVHNTLDAPIPVLEFHGKNTGIRRARGEYVLTTNPDILLSNELINEFARRWLRKDHFYRTDRYDYVGTGIENINSDALVEFAVANTFQAHMANGSADVPAGSEVSVLPASDPTVQYLHTNGAGDFILASREVFFTARGLWENTQQRWHMDSYSVIRLAATGLKQTIFTNPMCAFHMHHARADTDAPWDPAQAVKVAPTRGDVNWGLGNIKLEEYTL